MNRNIPEPVRREIENCVFLCDAAKSTLEMTQGQLEHQPDLYSILTGVMTNVQCVRRDLNNILIASERKTEPTSDPAIDSEARLRMIAEAVSAMSNKEWSDASHTISRLFSYPAGEASNRVTIGKTPDEIMDIINRDRDW